MDIADQLKRLEDLRNSGALSQEEFEKAKVRLLNETEPSKPLLDNRSWLMVLHLSQLLGYAAPVAGFVVPVAIWLLKKDSVPGMDKHGREVINWILSSIIYAILAALACLIFIGVPLLIALIVVDIVFPIIAAVKAQEGTFWRYPMNIPFLKVPDSDN